MAVGLKFDSKKDVKW